MFLASLLLIACAQSTAGSSKEEAATATSQRGPEPGATLSSAASGATGSAAPPSSSSESVPFVAPFGSPWDSRDSCLAHVNAQQRLPRAAKTARLASWNIRWFPDGAPGNNNRRARPTDLLWLACAIIWTDLDVLALQEIKGSDHAVEAVAELLRHLEPQSGDEWRVELDSCPARGRQHVGLLVRVPRVQMTHQQNVGSLNPHGGDCTKQLRPGFGAYLKFPGGLDLHLVSVHFKSGPDHRSYDLRKRSLEAVPEACAELQDRATDLDTLVIGDFNTMGCRKCRPTRTMPQELVEFELRASQLSVPFRRLPSAPACSEYYRGHPGLLDLAWLTESTQEKVRQVQISGYCAELGCEKVPRDKLPVAYTQLSDHCPLIVDLEDTDRD